jgi:hypothetical protein
MTTHATATGTLLAAGGELMTEGVPGPGVVGGEIPS